MFRGPAQLPGIGLRAWGATRLVVALIVVGSLIRLVLAGSFGFGNGESYYYSCARHLDLSYFDHPPMHAWLARLAIDCIGFHPAAIRAPFILFFAGTTWLMYLLGRRMFGEWSGFYAAVVLNLSMVFSLTTASFLQPDSPLMFFWLLAFYGLARLFLEKTNHALLWWVVVGLAAGLAMLCKYHAAFLVLGTLVYVITSKDQRHWLRHPGPYLAVALMSACFIPVLMWNSEHEWISFLWQGGRGAEFKGLRFDWLGRSIMGQVLWLLPWIWVPLVCELYVCIRRGSNDPVRWLIACTATPPILFFTITALYAPYGFHFHWQAPGYLLLFLPLGATVERLLHSSVPDVRFTRRWLKCSALFFAGAFLFLASHTVTGWLIEVLPEKIGNELAVVDPTLEALDYAPLEKYLAQQGLLDRDDLFVFTPRWYMSGKVDYALHGRARVYCFSFDDPRAFAFFDDQAKELGKDGILITHERYCNGGEDWYAANFENIKLLATVDVPRGARTGARLKVFYAKHFLSVFPQPYGKTRKQVESPQQMAQVH